MKRKSIILIFIFSFFLFMGQYFCFAASLDEVPADAKDDLSRDKRIEEVLKDEEAAKSKAEICQPGQPVEEYPFYIYRDADYRGNHFFPSGYMGDYMDIRFDLYHKDNPYSGATCIKMDYSGKAYQGGKWAGLYWQDPAGNWGDTPGGFDLSQATKFTFWARGERGGEIVTVFKIGGILGEYGDFASKTIGPVILTRKWKKYTIDLAHLDRQPMQSCPDADLLSRVIGGFAWVTNIDVNQGGIIFYLDEMRYEKD